MREALRLLEAEGLVVSEPNRGAMVRPLSSTEVVDLYGLRIRLESYAVEVATERATEAELGELVEAADAFGAARRSVDVDTVEGVRQIHEANRRFHDGILAAARHRRLDAMLARTVDIPLVFQAFRSFGPAEIERSDVFHHLIVEAMCRRDAERGVRPDGRAHRPGPRRGARRDRPGGAMSTIDARAPAALPRAARRDRARRPRRRRPLLRAGDDDVVQRHRRRPPPARRTSTPSRQGAELQRRRLYNDRTIDTFDDGFLARTRATVVAARRVHGGALWACLVAQVRDGKIVQLVRVPRLEQVPAEEAPAEGRVVMTEYETRELCERFLDAYQDGRRRRARAR